MNAALMTVLMLVAAEGQTTSKTTQPNERIARYEELVNHVQTKPIERTRTFLVFHGDKGEAALRACSPTVARDLVEFGFGKDHLSLDAVWEAIARFGDKAALYVMQRNHWFNEPEYVATFGEDPEMFIHGFRDLSMEVSQREQTRRAWMTNLSLTGLVLAVLLLGFLMWRWSRAKPAAKAANGVAAGVPRS